MKHEWKKHEKNLYLPESKAVLVTVPKSFRLDYLNDKPAEAFLKCSQNAQ